jgi:fermentation-respiration switch protein FrsA (DUF1100 family)
LKHCFAVAGLNYVDTATDIEVQLIWRGIRDAGNGDLLLETGEGDIACRFHSAAPGNVAVVWICGAGGGFNGPASGLYPRLSHQLAARGIASLELAYRNPRNFIGNVLDVLVGVAYLESIERSSVIIVGHSMGGAVAIAAGAASENVIGVATLSSQTAAATAISKLSPRPVLLVHGTEDEILPVRCAYELYYMAREPKQLILYRDTRHGLDERRDELDRDLAGWIITVSEM